jgi:hypothetical protein
MSKQDKQDRDYIAALQVVYGETGNDVLSEGFRQRFAAKGCNLWHEIPILFSFAAEAIKSRAEIQRLKAEVEELADYKFRYESVSK